MSVHNRQGAAGARRTWSGAVLILVGPMLAVVMACTGNPAISTSSGSTTTGTPNGSGAVPLPTHWPGNTIEATIGLGVADTSFVKVGKDLSAAVDAGDLARLLTVTDDVRRFLAANQTQIAVLQAYPETKSVGDRLAPAYAQMAAGVKQIHDSLVAGDGNGVTAGFATFSAGNTVYAAVRGDLGRLVSQALEMKRHYNL